MRPFILVFLIALTITAFSTPWIRRLAIAIGFVDAPAARKMHSAPMPLMGGVAIFAGAIIAVLFFFRQEIPRPIVGALIAGTLVATIGLIDDRYHVPPGCGWASTSSPSSSWPTSASASACPSPNGPTTPLPSSGWWALPTPSTSWTTWTA